MTLTPENDLSAEANPEKAAAELRAKVEKDKAVGDNSVNFEGLEADRQAEEKLLDLEAVSSVNEASRQSN